MAGILNRISSVMAHNWNIFQKDAEQTDFKGQPKDPYVVTSSVSTIRPDKTRLRYTNGRTITASIYTRIALDVSSMPIRHVRTDKNGAYFEEMKSPLNDCLTLSANIDQTSKAFIFDAVLSMLDEGVIAIVPVETSVNLRKNGAYDIYSMRVGKIVDWRPQDIDVELYNEKTGNKEIVRYLPKDKVAIIENPFYSVMNENNSTLKRLTHKLALLDAADDTANSPKLDIVIQLPYSVKGETRQQQADKRRQDIENQLVNSKYGIAYIDGTEKITQLNRPAENNLLTQIDSLTKTLYNQLGLTEAVFDGTADERAMLNYYNRTIEPILSAFTLEMKRKFLTKTARTQGQSIEYYRDVFKLVSALDMAQIADAYTRNEILSSNEIRGLIGFEPSDDPMADELRNSNIAHPEDYMMYDETQMPLENQQGDEYYDEAAVENQQYDNPMDVPYSQIGG